MPPTPAITAPAEPNIVIRWLARLRWLAVAGQAFAVGIAAGPLHLRLPLNQIIGIIFLAAFSNIVLQLWTFGRAPRWLVPAILLLDVLLLTALLDCTGGPNNPFAVLYLVHVAMAVATLTEGRSWLIVGASAACYASLFTWHPLGDRTLDISPMTRGVADWIALALVAVLIAYFVGRMTRSLRRHEQELLDARERAARNEQLAALTTLAAGAAHELNTPLGTIAVVARELEVMSQKLQSDGSLASDARLIRQEVDRCNFILSRMRVDVLQGETPKMTTIKPSDLAAILYDDLKPIAGDMLRVEFDRSPETISIPLRAVQQAVNILVDNALDASQPGKVVTLGVHRQNGWITLEVRDQGTGMNPETIRRAGEPFFTTKPPGEGMGLGLFLARMVAEKFGGHLRIKSEPGCGTRAILQLPANTSTKSN